MNKDCSQDKESFKIKAVGAELYSYINIMGHVLIKINDWSSMSVDRGNGEEEDYEYGSAGISLDKNRAIQLRDKLNEFIETITEKSGNEDAKKDIESEDDVWTDFLIQYRAASMLKGIVIVQLKKQFTITRK